MKNFLLLSSILLSLFITPTISSCNEHKNNDDSAKVQTGFLGDTTIFTTGPRDPSNKKKQFDTLMSGQPSSYIINNCYTDAWEHGKAADSIDKFDPFGIKDLNNYFIVNVSQLKDYLDSGTHDLHNSYMNFLLAWNKPESIILIAACIDTNYDNVYFKCQQSTETNVLKLKSYLSNRSPFSQPSTMPTGANNIPNSIHALEISKANIIVNNYLDHNTSDSTRSFNVDADDLFDYLNKLKNANVNDLHIFLGVDHGRKVMILAGFNGSSYFYFSAKNLNGSYLYEHCYPCPICITYGDGAKIER